MPYLPTAQCFLEQSTLLISAHPTTTRITTKYQIPHPNPPVHPYKPSRKATDVPLPPPSNASTTATATTITPTPRRRNLQPMLILKTYDPASGVCLKYRTEKAAEVGRLVSSLAQCGRVMAALPLKMEEVQQGPPLAEGGDGGGGGPMEGVVREDEGGSREGGKVVQGQGGQAQGQGQGKAGGGDGGGGGGGKKKKKGKR